MCGEWSCPPGHPLGAQFRAHRVVNEQLIELYWTIGPEILAQQDKQGWGSGVTARLAGWSRATLYRHQAQQATRDSAPGAFSGV